MEKEGELRGQLTNPGSPGKMAVKTVCVCRCVTDRQTDGRTDTARRQRLCYTQRGAGKRVHDIIYCCSQIQTVLW